MIISENRNWLIDYKQIVIDSINDSFPPEEYFNDIDGIQLVWTKRWSDDDDTGEFLRDFTGKTWDQIDHNLISYHRAAPTFMSYYGFMKFLPALLIDLFADDCQLDDRVLYAILEHYASYQYDIPGKYALNNDQIICCILALHLPEDFPIDTNFPLSSEENVFYVGLEFLYPAMTHGLPSEQKMIIQSKIEEINTWFLERC